MYQYRQLRDGEHGLGTISVSHPALHFQGQVVDEAPAPEYTELSGRRFVQDIHKGLHVPDN
jgi:hypothetical protein